MGSRACVNALMLASTLMAAAQTAPVATRPKFTVGRETTLIEGPMNADGTVNYRAAINELMSKGVTNDNNAAPLLLSIADHRLPKDDAVFEALHLPVPGADSPVLQGFDDYLAKLNKVQPPTDDDWGKFISRSKLLQMYPWKADEEKQATAWLKASAPALAIVEKAAARPRFFLPLIQEKDASLLVQELPNLTPLLRVSRVLVSRAMLRAGEGQWREALTDLNRTRLLARLADQAHFSLTHIMALAIELQAMQSYASLAASGISGEQLTALRQEIESKPDLGEMDDTTLQVEEMMTLDAMMSLIRDDGQPLLRLESVVFGNQTINTGDLDKVDWDAALKEVVGGFDKARNSPDTPLADQLKEMDAKIASDSGAKYPLTILSPDNVQLSAIQTSVEAFLKMRDGESREAYSRRIGGWLAAGTPQDGRRLLLLEQRPRTMRKMALLAISLAKYRLDHGQYPDSLKSLAAADVLDPYSGKELLYRRDDDGYVLWSIGINQKDDGGKDGSDDLVVRSHPAPATR